MQRSLGFLTAILCLAAFAADAVGQQTARTLPGAGVADPAGKVGFFPGVKGGVDALELATGKLLWSVAVGGQTLLATNDRLFVLKGSDTIRVLDSADGKLLLEAKPLGFPGWVSVEPAYGLSFRSGARTDGKSLWLTWEANAFYAGGARPTPEIEKAARKAASGVAHVDLETGKVEALDADKSKRFPMPAEAINPKIGDVTLSVKTESAKNPMNPFQQRRTLHATNVANEPIWQREIAAPVFLPPRP